MAAAQLRKVVIADKFSKPHEAALRKLGLEVTANPDLKDAALKAAIPGVEILIVRSTKVTADILSAADRLKLIIRAGAGVDTIDVPAASARGIPVANCPGTNSLAVAELVLGLILALDRRIPENVAALQAGKWNKKEFSKADGLAGKTLGIIGLGQIGRAVAVRAKAFGLKLLGWDKWCPIRAGEVGIDECPAELLDLASRSDIVTCHLALSAESRHLLGRDFFARMKPRAILINASRGEIVDTPALVEAVKTKGLRVGLDVYEGEPATPEAELPPQLFELARLPGVFGTHHIGASTEQAQEAVADETVRIVRAFLADGSVPNCVNAKETARR